jgi:hypothetical protein
MPKTDDILKQRGESYGSVSRGGNITRIAALWSAYLNIEITEHDVGWLMVLLKASRSKADPSLEDNYLDACGYVDIARTLTNA